MDRRAISLSRYELDLLIWCVNYRADDMILEEEEDRKELEALAELRDRLNKRKRSWPRDWMTK